ncbi:olfactory receptor 11H6-like [Sphaerodactylus townsendi]|uniref:olfactory receptor 11H6-like n=1 Tax=Sphaerodactylus townsendi TaxID=933632 RepID=UPI00202733B8|nr:olfactory receptor 11H6-like [Sphaerodactylus townsendi]XP_048338327.1 olfactory receptor 11H6-like [Sphaerodactylus townsendi]
MELANETSVQEFILIGFRVGQQERFFLLIFFAILYVLTLAENFTIITLVHLDAHLGRLPMYILLSHFSWLEMCYVSTIVPRVIFDLSSPQGIISFRDCFLQFYLLFSFGTTEDCFLSAMALDRYLAICHPLRYPQIMSTNSCCVLVAACWVVGFMAFAVPVTMMSQLSFCGPNIIDHFLCDAGPILSLACLPLGIAPLLCQISLNIVLLGNIFFVVLSYGFVIVTLMKPSFQGSRRRAFSTISFHLVVVTLFFGSVSAMYIIPDGENQSEVTKAVTLFYTSITPFLNPMIYCLRNDQVKEAVGRLRRRKVRFQGRKMTI